MPKQDGYNYVDENGYEHGSINHSDLVHRQIAYNEIYLLNKDAYPLPFSKYVVHHIDGDKRNNNISNLMIVTPEEHEKLHGILKPMTWEQKKQRANKKDFSVIRLPFGDNVVRVLKLSVIFGFILGFVFVTIGFVILNDIIFNIGVLFFKVGIMGIILTLVLGVIGSIYNKIGNFYHNS